MINFSRQEALWGSKGQKIISDSSVAIIGADNLGVEVARSLAILGIGKMYLVDKKVGNSNTKFMDIPFVDKVPKVKSLESMLKVLNDGCKIRTIDSDISKAYLGMMGPIDGVIDTSNLPQSQEICQSYCQSREIPLFTAVADRKKGMISLYNPNDDNKFGRNIILPGYEDWNQGIIISNIFSGIVVEEFRKSLFIKYMENFGDDEIIMETGRVAKLTDLIEKDKVMLRDVFYNINGNKRTKSQENDLGVRGEGDFQGKRILIVGGGAGGNYLAEMAARLYAKKLDILDFDVFADHNLTRQPLGYGSVGKLKAETIAQRVQNITNFPIESNAIIGYIGTGKNEKIELKIAKLCKTAKDPIDQSRFKVVDASSIEGKYDLILGAVDSIDARKELNSIVLQLGVPYVDMGSSPWHGGRANVYVPGETGCLGCTMNLEYYPIDINDKLKNEEGLSERMANLQGCAFVAGSVNMSNQAAAGLAISEARFALKNEGGLIDKVSYVSDSALSKLQVRKANACSCT